MPKLAPPEVQKRVAQLHGWKLVDNALEREWNFGNDFMAGIRFVNEVARVAEELEHHPDISIHWTQVKLRIWSHDEGGITERDFRLAKAIDEEFASTGE